MPVHTTSDFVQNRLPEGRLPNYETAQDDHRISIPFAVHRWSDGLDYGEDEYGNEYVYQDEPPSWYLAGAFLTRNEAEQFIQNEKAQGVKATMVVEENVEVAYWQFTHCYIPGLQFGYNS